MMERYMGYGAALVLAAIILSGIFAPQLAPMNPFEPNMAVRLQPPSAAHLLGTDALGRDLLSRTIYGGRSALLLSLVSTVLALGIGTLVGLLAGYFGGWTDDVLLTVSNIFQGIPGISFMVAVAGFVGPGITGLLLALVVGSWAGFARIVRAEVMQLAAEPYVEQLRVRATRGFSCGTSCPRSAGRCSCSALCGSGAACSPSRGSVSSGSACSHPRPIGVR